MKSIITSFIFLCASLACIAEWKEAKPFEGELPYRHHPVTFTIDGYGYMLTGVGAEEGSLGNQFLTNDFYRYDPVADSWERLPDFPGFPRGFAYGDTTGGKAYVGFGLGPNNTPLRDLWEYDPETQTWTELAPCPGTARLHPAFVAEDGHVVVGMGNGDGGNFKDFWHYTIETNSWEQMPDIPGFARHHPFYFGIDGIVYAGLGHGSESITWNGVQTVVYNTWYSWEIGVSTEWTEHDKFPGEPRVAGEQFSFNGRGYVVSGQGHRHTNLDEGEFWEYIPETDTWTQLESHSGGGRWAPGNFILNSKLYLYGGEATVPGPPGSQEPVNTMLTYDLIPASVLADNTGQNVYPNPASNYISLLNSDNSSSLSIANADYRIIDISGSTAAKGNISDSNNIDISSLSSGTYFIYFKDADKKIHTARFVKN